MTLLAEDAIILRYRLANPESRIESITPYRLNTGRRKARRCIACGEGGPTWSAECRETVRAIAWAISLRSYSDPYIRVVKADLAIEAGLDEPLPEAKDIGARFA